MQTLVSGLGRAARCRAGSQVWMAIVRYLPRVQRLFCEQSVQRFGGQEVALVRLVVGLRKLRRDQPYLMTLFSQRGAHKVCSTTCLKADQ
jgi:hypothetical protein